MPAVLEQVAALDDCVGIVQVLAREAMIRTGALSARC
jgi:hypothetical protein